MNNFKWEIKDCKDRHPKICKWMKSRYGCKRGKECDYLRVTPAKDERNISEQKESSYMNEFKCIGCKSVFTDGSCVLKHVIKNMRRFFCLNCEDWVKDKTKVLDQDWTLIDKDGYLRTDI